jgi:hypothetical protein
MQPSDLDALASDLQALLADITLERRINAVKVSQAPPGAYPYGEGMHDGLRYAAEGLEKILLRYGLTAPSS